MSSPANTTSSQDRAYLIAHEHNDLLDELLATIDDLDKKLTAANEQLEAKDVEIKDLKDQLYAESEARRRE